MLLRLAPRKLDHQPFQLINRVKQTHAAPSIIVRRLQQPEILSVKHTFTQCDAPVASALLCKVYMCRKELIDRFKRFLVLAGQGILIALLVFLHQVEIRRELIILKLAVGISNVNDECNGHKLIDVLMKVLAKFCHVLKKLILSGEHLMVVKVIHQILLAVFTQKVKPDLWRNRCPLEMVEGVRGLDLAPAGACVEDPLDHRVVVAPQHYVFVKVLLLLELLLIQT